MTSTTWRRHYKNKGVGDHSTCCRWKGILYFPAAVINGHISQMGKDILRYVNDNRTQWEANLSASYGTECCQLHDNKKQNKAFKSELALSKSRFYMKKRLAGFAPEIKLRLLSKMQSWSLSWIANTPLPHCCTGAGIHTMGTCWTVPKFLIKLQKLCRKNPILSLGAVVLHLMPQHIFQAKPSWGWLWLPSWRCKQPECIGTHCKWNNVTGEGE